MLQLRNTLRFTEISNDYAIAEVKPPEKYIGHKLATIDIPGRFDLRLVAVKKPPEKKVMNSIFRKDYDVIFDFGNDEPLAEGIILVLAGKTVNIKRFTES